MTVDLARVLLSSGVCTRQQTESALLATQQQSLCFLRALLLQNPSLEAAIENELDRVTSPALPSIVPRADLIARLPAGMCARLLALPIRTDQPADAVEVATACPFDLHLQAEFEFQLRAPVRLRRARVRSLTEALEAIGQLAPAIEPAPGSAQPTTRRRRRTPAFGSPSFRGPAERVSDVPIPLVRKSLSPRRSPPPESAGSADRGIDPSWQLDPGRASRPARSVRMNSPLGRTSSLGSVDPGDIGSHAASTLASARTRDEVVDALIAVLQPAVRGVGVLALRKGAFEGWCCTAELADQQRFKALRVTSNEPDSALLQASTTGLFAGRIPQSEVNAELRSVLPDGPVLIAPVRIAERCAMLVVCRADGDQQELAARTLEAAREAGESLARVLASEKRTR